MNGSYYDRENRVIDGITVFATQEDADNEEWVSGILEPKWGCKLHRFGMLSPIDWYATKNGLVAAFIELKSRSHEEGTYPTVFLNVRKYMALQIATVAMGVPAFFVVNFSRRSIRMININNVEASKMKIGGCKQQVKSISDVEPVIEVPIKDMQKVWAA